MYTTNIQCTLFGLELPLNLRGLGCTICLYAEFCFPSCTMGFWTILLYSLFGDLKAGLGPYNEVNIHYVTRLVHH